MKNDRPRASLHGLVFAFAMLSIALNNANAYAASEAASGIRVAKAVQKFDEVRQVATIFNLRPPRRLHSRHLELAVGGLSTRTEGAHSSRLARSGNFSTAHGPRSIFAR